MQTADLVDAMGGVDGAAGRWRCSAERLADAGAGGSARRSRRTASRQSNSPPTARLASPRSGSAPTSRRPAAWDGSRFRTAPVSEPGAPSAAAHWRRASDAALAGHARNADRIAAAGAFVYRYLRAMTPAAAIEFSMKPSTKFAIGASRHRQRRRADDLRRDQVDRHVFPHADPAGRPHDPGRSASSTIFGLKVSAKVVPRLDPARQANHRVDFTISDGVQSFPVDLHRASSSIPDTFTDANDIDVVVEGKFGRDRTFHATT